MSIPALTELAYLVIPMDGSALKSAQENKLYDAKKLACIDRGATYTMKLHSQELTFQKLVAVVTFLFKIT
jgi:hypothetical protein